MENSIKFLVSIKKTYPEFNFKQGKRFSFHPKKTITYSETENNFELLLLHELGHALNGDFSFKTDIERLKIEMNAWETAKKLANSLNVTYDEEFIENELDSYRNWLHKKSLCKSCGLTRYQTPDGVYHCPHCEL
ncbi:hypothetical protein IKG45_02075 [Candidatus Saccharibacteria bacterium]|nr:hypothetical protein [Candidatus Saccharibacteria bacterium]